MNGSRNGSTIAIVCPVPSTRDRGPSGGSRREGDLIRTRRPSRICAGVVAHERPALALEWVLGAGRRGVGAGVGRRRWDRRWSGSRGKAWETGAGLTLEDDVNLVLEAEVPQFVAVSTGAVIQAHENKCWR